jgi:hypothetical protein
MNSQISRQGFLAGRKAARFPAGLSGGGLNPEDMTELQGKGCLLVMGQFQRREKILLIRHWRLLRLRPQKALAPCSHAQSALPPYMCRCFENGLHFSCPKGFHHMEPAQYQVMRTTISDPKLRRSGDLSSFGPNTERDHHQAPFRFSPSRFHFSHLPFFQDLLSRGSVVLESDLKAVPFVGGRDSIETFQDSGWARAFSARRSVAFCDRLGTPSHFEPVQVSREEAVRLQAPERPHFLNAVMPDFDQSYRTLFSNEVALRSACVVRLAEPAEGPHSMVMHGLPTGVINCRSSCTSGGRPTFEMPGPVPHPFRMPVPDPSNDRGALRIPFIITTVAPFELSPRPCPFPMPEPHQEWTECALIVPLTKLMNKTAQVMFIWN